jgi:dTDP-4-dehydrorhamnose reductase
VIILVFGEGGQIAIELGKLAHVICLGRDVADLEVPSSCSDAINHFAPDAVINAAAYTAVDKAETDRETAHLVNSIAPNEMAKACALNGIPFIHISTDYVFDGSGDMPWRETDFTGPLSVYGKTKLQGEANILATNPLSLILRTSWVFSSHRTNFLKSMLRMSKNKTNLSIVDDQIGGPTPAAEIAKVCHHLASNFDSSKSGIYHYSGAPNVSWAGFATEIFKQAGQPLTIIPIKTRDYPTPAIRPLNSRMDCASIKQNYGLSRPCWKSGLNEVLRELGVI